MIPTTRKEPPIIGGIKRHSRDEEVAVHEQGSVKNTSGQNTICPPDYDAKSHRSVKSSSSTEDKVSECEVEVLWVEYEPNDPRQPINFSRSKKWAITLVACFATFLSGSAVAAYPFGYQSMIRDLNCTEFQATLGLSSYTLGLGIVPMFISALSEEFGRWPLFLWSSLGYELCFAMIAWAPNIETVIIGRFIQGGLSSTGATMVGGTIADIWSIQERGPPMAVFSFASVANLGVGAIMAGWSEMNSMLGWKWIQWIQMTWSGVFVLVILFWFPETRATLVLEKIAKKLRKKTGDRRYKANVQKPSTRELIWISCKRPIRLTFTEPVVASFSLWLAFCWGVLYCLINSISSVFQDLHHFNIGQTGLVFITMMPISGEAISVELHSAHYIRRKIYEAYA
ncbi:hypothetical protein NP233_g5354 [Leucocoprinus birnbaumii]|uniref:Major facilitator superfamily (MFS) profile domain-containing protein n=1 Tax=Leucocoprinus birnbaumii TaxID=56174 RepID=A0AAD5YWU2_9AGAR|nr:hypothetical protein NP233_g5354 [Leucocoprinus birnbaumii]